MPPQFHSTTIDSSPASTSKSQSKSRIAENNNSSSNEDDIGSSSPPRLSNHDAVASSSETAATTSEQTEKVDEAAPEAVALTSGDVLPSSSSSSPTLLSYAQKRVYSQEDLQLFNLLTSPVWIFDITNKLMWWANSAGCEVWEAPNAETLRQRDFKSDMSATSENAMNAWLERFKQGDQWPVTWTLHPNGGKEGPKTCEMVLSGIFVRDTDDSSNNNNNSSKQNHHEEDIEGKSGADEGHLCMLVHVKKVTFGKSREPENATTIRRTEMLRHFPIVARQFSIEGKLMDQNPQAHAIFGLPFNGPQPETESNESSSNINHNNNNTTTTTTMSASASNLREKIVAQTQQEEEEERQPEPDINYDEDGGAGATTTSCESNLGNNNHNHNHRVVIQRPIESTSTSSSNRLGENSNSTGGTFLDRSSRSTGSSSISFAMDSSTRSHNNNNLEICDFLAQFVDLDEGKQVLEEIRDGHDYSTETQQITLEGPKWFTVNVRRIQDPVTSEQVIIYSARDITKVMESARLQAEKENMRRHEFFAVMAHEIRTPLHQVVGFIELLASSGLNEEQTESVDVLQSSTHALMAIINDLLDFTKLEAGKMKLEIIPFEVRGVLDGSVAAVQPQVIEKGLNIHCNVDPRIPIKMLGDPNRLRQVVLNMLTNAIKFTKRGEIVVESKRILEKDDDGKQQMTIRFTVKDSGIGIPKDKCSRIFSAYQQADASVSRNYGGTGLGLAICKSLVKNMGGTIGVESELGKGAMFWFEIPFGKVVMKAHHDRNTPTGSIDSNSGHSLNDLTTFNVLVAEDNKVNQKVICKMLQRLGHDVKIVQNGQEAVTEIVDNQHTKCYDLVLMDWQMPVMDGIDATKEIRRKGFGPGELPIVGLTASIQGLDWSNIGMNDCLKKPIRIPDLKAALLKNMSKK